MDIKQLNEGQELIKLIETTEKALSNLKNIKIKEPKDNKQYEDGLYWFNISEESDGSGWKTNLSRYFGNARLLRVIIEELEKQLKEFEEMLEKL